MSYITQAELEKRFGAGDLRAWTDDDASGSIDAAVVAEAIAGAEGELNGALTQHYTTPLSLTNAGTAALVRLHTGSIVGYRLAARRPANVPEDLRRQYEDAVKWLRDVVGGKWVLSGESAVAVARPSGGIVVGGTDTAAVTRTTMDGF